MCSSYVMRGDDTMTKPIPAVRILPMSANQRSFRGRTVEDVQTGFFLEELPRPPKNGRYRYPTSGLNAKPGTVVLFQYQNRVIASAVFEHHERFNQPENGYQGALWFDVQSIKTFDPVGPVQMRNLAGIQELRPCKAVPQSCKVPGF